MMAIISSDLSTTIAFSIRSLSLGLLLAGWTSLSSLAQTPASNNRNGNRVKIVNISSSLKNDQVTFSIEVTNSEGKAIEELDKNQLILTIDGDRIPSEDIIIPTEPPPAKIVILLDYSGSMTDNDTGGKTQKIEGAIKAIRMFGNKIAAKENTDIEISIAPFGESTGKCQDEINKNLLSADNHNPEQLLGDFIKVNSSSLDSLDKKLETLKNEKNQPCNDTTTNLYYSVAKALNFLVNLKDKDSDFDPTSDSQQQKPRLIVILLSDGFNSISFDPNENDICAPQHLEKLQNEYLTSETYSEVRIYTLGYGLTPEQLKREYQEDHPQYDGPIDCRTVKNDDKYKRKFVDKSALIKIARDKNENFAISGDEYEVIQAFDKFLQTILGEFKVIYTNPKFDRGTPHELKAEVNFPNGTTALDTRNFSIPLVRYVEPSKRLISLFGVGLLGILAIIPFTMWTNNLKKRR